MHTPDLTKQVESLHLYPSYTISHLVSTLRDTTTSVLATNARCCRLGPPTICLASLLAVIHQLHTVLAPTAPQLVHELLSTGLSPSTSNIDDPVYCPLSHLSATASGASLQVQPTLRRRTTARSSICIGNEAWQGMHAHATHDADQLKLACKSWHT